MSSQPNEIFNVIAIRRNEITHDKFARQESSFGSTHKYASKTRLQKPESLGLRESERERETGYRTKNPTVKWLMACRDPRSFAWRLAREITADEVSAASSELSRTYRREPATAPVSPPLAKPPSLK